MLLLIICPKYFTSETDFMSLHQVAGTHLRQVWATAGLNAIHVLNITSRIDKSNMSKQNI